MNGVIKLSTTSETISLNELFSNSKFTIPEIQRDYAWDAKDQVKKLFEDLWKYSYVTKHDISPQYFLGTVIVYSGHDDGSLQIMDGQQRITTITALMSAIKIHLERFEKRYFSQSIEGIDLKEVIHQLEDNFLFYDINSVTAKLQPKTDESVRMIDLMIRSNGTDPSTNEKLIAKDTSGVKIISCLRAFYKFIQERIDEEDTDEEKINLIVNFYNVIREKVVLTFTKTETMSMAFQMFVSVNGKSMPLNNYDLLRGLLVAKSHELGFDNKVSKDIKKLSKQMNLLSAAAGDKLTDGRISDSVRYWMESRLGKNVESSNVADEMENEIKNFESYSDFNKMITQLTGYVKAFTSINHTGRKGNDLSKKPDGWIQHRRILGAGNLGSNAWKAAHSLVYSSLLYSQEKNLYKSTDVITVMRALEWITLRYYDLRGNKVENLYPWASKRCIEGIPLDDWIDDFIQKLESLLDKAEIVGFTHLITAQISESKATVLLHAIRGSGQDPGPNTRTNICNSSKLLPTGAPAPWKCSPEKDEHGSVSNTIGNWFLMKDQLDSDIQKYPTDPLERVKLMKKHANTTAETTRLTEIFQEIKMSPATFIPVKSIKPRTKEIISELEEFWPKTFQKKI